MEEKLFLASSSEVVATVCFFLAVIHTFLVSKFQKIAHKYSEGSVGENFFHLLGEVEAVFGIWAAVYLVILSFFVGPETSIQYLDGLNFTEPLFVFVIMVVCATKPILSLASDGINFVSKLLPFHRSISFYITCLIVGPLLGSFITEPAAMTITALILLEKYYKQNISKSFMYATLGLLFVNVSIGGTLTPYAAPPVLMVAGTWGWDLSFMLKNFGWKAALAIIISTSIIVFRFKNELKEILLSEKNVSTKPLPIWISIIHVLFLIGIVIGAHHSVVFIGLFLFFLGLTHVTKEYQDELKLREGLLVAFFLGGLVVLGGPQSWWLEPVLVHLGEFPLYIGAISLTAITDNAALTYLGSQVPSLSEAARYVLVAGSVVGGGLTVIANAPNPAGYGILNSTFGAEGIRPAGLLKAALIPTCVAALCFWIL